MPMIVTGGICNYTLESTAKDLTRPENLTPGAGVRVVEVSAVPPPCRRAAEDNSSSSGSKCEETHFLGCSHRYEVV